MKTRRKCVSSTLLNNLLAQARRKSKTRSTKLLDGVLACKIGGDNCCNSPATVAAAD
jgi:hypothetical protein